MLKRSPYIRQFFILILYILLWIPNFFIAPIMWLLGIVNWVREHETPILVWFTNKDEPTVTEDNYGDDYYREARGISDIENMPFFTRFYWYVVWNVFRNSYFYFKLNVITPKPMEPTIVKVITNTMFGPDATKSQNLHILEYHDRGKIHTLEERDGTLYFRYSFTKEINLFGKRIWNVQLGACDIENMWGGRDTNRYLFKSKITKIENI